MFKGLILSVIKLSLVILLTKKQIFAMLFPYIVRHLFSFKILSLYSTAFSNLSNLAGCWNHSLSVKVACGRLKSLRVLLIYNFVLIECSFSILYSCVLPSFLGESWQWWEGRDAFDFLKPKATVQIVLRRLKHLVKNFKWLSTN